MTRRSRHPRRAFTLLELLVVLGILVILLSILVPTVLGVRRAGKQVECLSNLRQIGTAFVMFAGDHAGVLPDPAVKQASWEAALMPMLSPNAFRCPADEELFPAVASSYDWRDTSDPRSTLAGRRLFDAPADAVLVFDSLPGWHAKRKMNAVTVGGAATPMDDQACLANVGRAIRAPNAK